MSQITLTLKINDEEYGCVAGAHDTLLHVLRDVIGLTGTKRGCNQGICGACTVLINGKIVRGCLSLAANCEGAAITTIEGVARSEDLSLVQRAFLDQGAVQCGFCTPGMVLAATALLSERQHPDDDEIREALSGNLCRCSGYVKIVKAIRCATIRKHE